MTLRTLTLAAGFALAAQGAVAPALAQDSEPVTLGIVSFLTGPAAGPFGIPGRNAAEVVIEGINAGTIPAPYDSVGLGGRQIEPVYVDEAGASAAVVTEYRNLVQRSGADAVVGYISSGNCLAISPVAEELQTITLLYDCGTPRIFEEADYAWVFRVTPHATMDNVAAARYLLDRMPEVSSVAGINQNYAWGQDSWRDFTLALAALAPEVHISRELWPKLFAGEYGAEISALLASRAPVVHTSLWGGDLESFMLQSVARGLPQRTTLLMTAAEFMLARLADRVPEGTMIGARGPHGLLAPDNALNDWFVAAYEEKFGEKPVFPAYHMAQSLLGLKHAWDAAAAEAGGEPSMEQVAAALRGATIETPSGTIEMALGNGQQGIGPIAFGTYRYDRDTGEPELVDVIRYDARCVNPPADMDSVPWLEAGMPGAQCD